MPPSEKPFDPTPQRLARARREGDLPRTHEIVAFGAFAGGLFGVALAAAPLWALGGAALVAGTRGEFPAWIGIGAALALLPALGALAGATFAAVAAHGGIVLRAPRLRFDRILSGDGLRRIASGASALNALRASLAGAALAAALLPAVRDELFARLPSPVQAGVQLRDVAARILTTTLIAAGALALLDLARERAAWHKRLRLSHAEFKRELREGEGDPVLRGRRRRAHGALVRGSIHRLREAAFVVVNPQHVAVALEYAPPDPAVPRVVVRARDRMALEVRRRAHELAIPVVTEPPLARALYALTEEGDFAPRALYE